MEPIGLAASVITLVSATSAAGTLLTRLWSLRKQPEYMVPAMNEITDFRALMVSIHSILDSAGTSLPPDVVSEIERLLRRAEEQISALHQFLKSILHTEFKNGTEEQRLGGRAKLRELVGGNQRRLDLFRQELHSIKTSLSAMLAVANMRNTQVLRMSIQEVTMLHHDTSPVQHEALGLESRISMAANQSSLPNNDSADVAALTRVPVSTKPSSTDPQSRNESSERMKTRYVMVRTSQRSRNCTLQCQCRCHVPLEGQSPRWLQGLVGALFFSFTGAPVLNHRSCDITQCGNKPDHPGSLHFLYLFPAWLLPIGIYLTGSWLDLTGVGSSWSLKIPRVINSRTLSSQIIRLVKDGQILKLQKLMAFHRITEIDLTSRGDTLFEVAVRKYRADVCLMLIRQGVNLAFTGKSGHTQAETFLRRALTSTRLRPLLREVHELLDYVDVMGMNVVHEIVLGRSSEDLATYLKADPGLVHGRDRLGYTPLHYACRLGYTRQDARRCGFRKSTPEKHEEAYRRQLRIIDQLLESGSNVNALCKFGSSPLSLAAEFGMPTICQNLLDVGADPNLKDCEGKHALFKALRNSATSLRLETAEILIKHGANLDEREDQGFTPLIYSTFNNQADICEMLLVRGADINAMDLEGRSVIWWAVKNNNAPVVELLCRKGVILKPLSTLGSSIICNAARNGSIEIFRILKNARIQGLDMSSEKMKKYWYQFDYRRSKTYNGKRMSIEIEREEFAALLESVIPLEEKDQRIHLPGSFPLDEEPEDVEKAEIIEPTEYSHDLDAL